MLLDLASLLGAAVALYVVSAPVSFRIVVAVGIVLAGLCWYVCTAYTRLWNRRFHVTLSHHLVCGFASACTLVFVILFPSLQYTREAALASIALWQVQINSDRAWNDQTFAKAYERVRALGTENFANVPAPGQQGSFIPTNSDTARQTAALMYVNEACSHFDVKRPFLSKVVWTSPGVPSETLFKDVRAWHERNPSYPVDRAVSVAAEQIKSGLDRQAPRVTSLARVSVVLLFVLVQAIPFGVIGWAAYRDIKVGR